MIIAKYGINYTCVRRLVFQVEFFFQMSEKLLNKKHMFCITFLSAGQINVYVVTVYINNTIM